MGRPDFSSEEELRRELLAVKEQLAKVTEERDDWENSMKCALDPCDDEKHCGCVPFLRKKLAQRDAVIAGRTTTCAGGFHT